MTARTVVAWIVAAVLGLVVAVAITLAASQLSSQRVGLSGEPLSAGDQLVPRAQPSAPARRPSPPSQPAAGDEAGEARGDD
jgi:predicted lipid-binding transport protein (Tim44 family)